MSENTESQNQGNQSNLPDYLKEHFKDVPISDEQKLKVYEAIKKHVYDTCKSELEAKIKEDVKKQCEKDIRGEIDRLSEEVAKFRLDMILSASAESVRAKTQITVHEVELMREYKASLDLWFVLLQSAQKANLTSPYLQRNFIELFKYLDNKFQDEDDESDLGFKLFKKITSLLEEKPADEKKAQRISLRDAAALVRYFYIQANTVETKKETDEVKKMLSETIREKDIANSKILLNAKMDYEDQMKQYTDFIKQLGDYAGKLLLLRDAEYDGSWAKFTEDLQKEKPSPAYLKTVSNLQEQKVKDLDLINTMREFEVKNRYNLADVGLL